MRKDQLGTQRSELKSCLWRANGELPSTQLGAALHRTESDVVIIGGGYTGLWTAYWLKKLAPNLEVVVVEKHAIGHGASGRNGGWLMGSLEGLHRFVHNDSSLSEHVVEELRGLVSSVTAVLTELGIDCDLKLGGGLFAAARYAAQAQRAQSLMHEMWALGFNEDDYHWLSALQLQTRVNVSRPLGAVATPHVATLHPGKLVQGLASAVQQLGVTIEEQCAAVSVGPHTVETTRGVITSKHVVMATEGYSEKLPMETRLLSICSGMVCTAPLPEAQWQALGFAQHEAFCDFSRASTYLQRTADNRLVVGARGTYRLGNKPWHPFDASATGTSKRLALAKNLFSDLDDVQFTHAWEGSLGVPRRFAPHVVFDTKTNISTAGGYLGEGVGASFLFGRTLAEGITGEPSDRLQMPWVIRGDIRQVIPRWEFEPLPWLGFSSMMATVALEEIMLSHNIPGGSLITKLCDLLESALGIR